MSSVNFGRLSSLCNEINELEAKVREAAREEFKPALIETINILKEYVPQVLAMRWQQYIPDSYSDTSDCWMNEPEFSFVGVDFGEPNENITKEQDDLLNELISIINSLPSASQLAFGNNVQITLDIKSGDLKIEEYNSF